MSNINTRIANEIARTVVENWRSDDGTSWYRKWSDGWIEQGGKLLQGDSAVTFPAPFTEIPLLCYLTVLNSTHVSSWAPNYISVKVLTKTGFTKSPHSNNVVPELFWSACGY